MALANDRGMGYRFVPDLFGVFAASSTMATVDGIPVMEVRLTSLDGWATVASGSSTSSDLWSGSSSSLRCS